MHKKKLFIKTYGCQMNVYDSERMRDLLAPKGYELVDGGYAGADLVILNTCHIREKAADKLYSDLGRIRREKSKKPDMLITVAGCVAQAEGEEVFRRAPYVDVVVGPQSVQELPDLISKVEREAGRASALEFAAEPKFDNLPNTGNLQGPSAFLTIQEGCDKFCTFCVVPYTRGAEFSRPVPEIYREALDLVSRGAKEIQLLGQNVNAYHGMGLDGDSWDLTRLLWHLSKITGLERIRYTTSHPRDMNDALIQAHGEVEKLMPLLHLPVQSGSNTILKAMNRKHTRDDYLRTIEKLRKARPEIQFSSDFIVGFPGETDQDFEDTMDLVRQVEFAQCYSFKYSPRPGTPAEVHEVQVDEKVKYDRLQALQGLLNEQQHAFNRSCVGQKMQLLIEKPGRKPGQMIGRTPYMQSTHVVTNASVGEMIEVGIASARKNSLEGQVIGARKAA